SWSPKLPGKCIRWSVAMEPVTAMRTGFFFLVVSKPLGATRGYAKAPPAPRRNGTSPAPFFSVERVATGARAGGVGVVDGEALLLDGVDEVDGGAHEVGSAHPVGDHAHAAEVGHHVAVHRAVIEEELVAQPGATARLHGNAQLKTFLALLLEQALDLGRS